MKSPQRVAVLSDFQVPFHRPDAIAWAVEVVRGFRPHHLVVNGDVLDLDGISRHADAEFSDGDYVDDCRTAAEILRELRHAAKGRRRVRPACVFLDGNHDRRAQDPKNPKVRKYLRAAVDWKNLRGCDEIAFRWKRLPYRKRRDGIYAVGKILIAHGWETGVNSDELEAIQLVQIAGQGLHDQLVVRGHTHRVVHPFRCGRTKRIPLPLWAANCGAFCDPSRMDWTDPLNVDQWWPAVGLFETTNEWWGGDIHEWPGEAA